MAKILNKFSPKLAHSETIMSVAEVCKYFAEILKRAAEVRLLKRSLLQDFTEMSRSLHGLLCSAFVEAGWRSNLIPIVEPRIELREPLNPPDYSKHLHGKRKRRQIRFDVGFCQNDQYISFAEVNTIDVALGYNSSQNKDFITKRDVYYHFAKQAGIKYGFIVCLTLPREVKKRPPWLDQKSIKDYFTEVGPQWKGLVNGLRKYLDAHVVIIEERGIHIDEEFLEIPFP